jgi:hypothetical protein
MLCIIHLKTCRKDMEWKEGSCVPISGNELPTTGGALSCDPMRDDHLRVHVERRLRETMLGATAGYECRGLPNQQ